MAARHGEKLRYVVVPAPDLPVLSGAPGTDQPVTRGKALANGYIYVGHGSGERVEGRSSGLCLAFWAQAGTANPSGVGHLSTARWKVRC